MRFSTTVAPNLDFGPLRAQWSYGCYDNHTDDAHGSHYSWRQFQWPSATGPLVIFGVALWLFD